eukprot:1881487-Rhodomonas_salina.2
MQGGSERALADPARPGSSSRSQRRWRRECVGPSGCPTLGSASSVQLNTPRRARRPLTTTGRSNNGGQRSRSFSAT